MQADNTVEVDPAMIRQERKKAADRLAELARSTKELLNEMVRPRNLDTEVGSWLHEIRATTKAINKALKEYNSTL